MPSTATKKKTAKRPAKKPRVDVDQVVTDRIIEALSNGVVPWRCKWARDAAAIPRNATTGNEYRGINVLMLVLGGYASPFWLTFNQAKAHGGAPRKGEHGMPCVRWVEWDRVIEPEEVAALQAQGKPIKRDKKGRPVARTIGPRLFWVFNIEQCDGLEGLQLPEVSQVARTDWDPIEGAEQYARGYENGPTITESGDRAFYRPSDDVANYPERDRFPDPADFYLTAFHELVHSTGHPDRLNRRDLAEAMTKNRASYSREELTAEVGAAMLCAHAGLEIPAEESASYIAGWLEALRGDHRLVITAAQHAQKGVDLIRGEQA